MNRLSTKLSTAFILVVVLGVTSVSALVRVETTRGFETYLDAQGTNYLTRVADSLSVLFRQDGQLGNSLPLLMSSLRSPSDRLVVSDQAGHIVADTNAELVGQSASSLDALNQAPILVGPDRVGQVYLLSFTPGPSASQGRGQSGGQGRGLGPMAGAEKGRGGAMGPQQGVVSLESAYLASVDRAILTAALLSALVAIAAGLIVSRWITRPLAELADASQKVAAGEFDRRLHVTSSDELGQVASSFNAMAEDLQKNEEARRHMVADIAHDLRTPLTVIQGMVDGMLDGVIEIDRAGLESIKEETGLLTKLVADLRTLSIADAGQLKLEKVTLDLYEFARRALVKVEPICRTKGIACRLEGESPGPTVSVDMDRMGQVVGNLLDNALRYTPAGGVVTLRVGAAREGRAILSVIDTGAGIGTEDLPHVFDRFYRADSSRARKSGGSGLGLAIVKQLVEAHGGRVRVESTPGAGTRFDIDLPTGS